MDYEAYIGRGIHKITGRDRPVTTLPNDVEWVENIYCLEAADNVYTADKVLGGVDGVANAPIQALTNRTNYLKDTVFKLLAYVNALQNALSAQLDNVKAAIIQKTDPNNSKYFWMKADRALNTSSFKITLADGRIFNQPVLRLTLETDRVIFVRTDGVSGDLSDINFD